MEWTNIGGNTDDAHYRYKRPKIVTKVEGRGNGTKTKIVNMSDIAKALERPPSYLTKYFGTELGAQSRFDEKTGASVVNGHHEIANLNALLEKFEHKYVKCYGCDNPETRIFIMKRNQTIQMVCKACSHVSDVDMKDKVANFILKNPPPAEDKNAVQGPKNSLTE